MYCVALNLQTLKLFFQYAENSNATSNNSNVHEPQVCHEQGGNHGKLRKLQQDVFTCWNSTNLMIVKLLEAKNDITSDFKQHPRNYSGPKLIENVEICYGFWIYLPRQKRFSVRKSILLGCNIYSSRF